MFDISRLAFTPPPKVTSSVVYITPKAHPLDVPLNKLETVSKFAFGQRRKMLRQSIKPIGGQELLDRAGIEGTRRAETLSVEEFVALARLI
jgi:16S rRNA (adenine1518-N6/adenine1519-N6)-dimethyltransferase